MKLVLMFVFLLGSGAVYAQQFFQRLEYVEAGVFIHSIGVPFMGDDFFRLDKMPGFSLGTSLPLMERERWQTDYRIRLSGYASEGLHTGFHLDNQIVESYKLGDFVKLEGAGGLGYLHTFESAGLYELSNGSYVPKRDLGRPQITISLGLGFSFRLNRNSPFWFFAQQQFLLQVPFASKSGVPLLMHNRSYFGIRREINRNFRSR